jgi:thymidylate synthase
MNNDHFVFEENLSLAWAKAFLKTIEIGVKEISPLVVVVSGIRDGEIPENDLIRNLLDKELSHKQQWSTHATANTIFPSSLWSKKRERSFLYKRYLKILNQLRKIRPNCYGLYFERLIDFGPKHSNDSKGINQLEEIIKIFRSGNHRRSVLQASVFDPSKDLNKQRQRGFPCLQQVSFVPLEKGELMISGFYPRELIFERAYGNYLGLCRLGHFMAHEMGLRLTKMQCMIGAAKYADKNKGDFEYLEWKLKELVGEYH